MGDMEFDMFFEEDVMDFECDCMLCCDDGVMMVGFDVLVVVVCIV